MLCAMQIACVYREPGQAPLPIRAPNHVPHPCSRQQDAPLLPASSWARLLEGGAARSGWAQDLQGQELLWPHSQPRAALAQDSGGLSLGWVPEPAVGWSWQASVP